MVERTVSHAGGETSRLPAARLTPAGVIPSAAAITFVSLPALCGACTRAKARLVRLACSVVGLFFPIGSIGFVFVLTPLGRSSPWAATVQFRHALRLLEQPA